MKNKLSIIIALAAVFGLSIIYSCEHELDSPPISSIDPNKVLEIKDIYQIHADSGDSYVFVDEYMIFATVTMDDSSGNIYKESYIQDTTGGINLYRLSRTGATKIGDYVRINLKGAEVVDYAGKMELVFGDVLDFTKSIVVQHSNSPIIPAEVTIDDILTGNYDCKLVTVNDVQFTDAELSKTYAVRGGTSTQNRNIQNCTGQTLIVRTSDYSSFAGDTVPQGKGSITGIMTKYRYASGDVVWQLLVRKTSEVDMNGSRCGQE